MATVSPGGQPQAGLARATAAPGLWLRWWLVVGEAPSGPLSTPLQSTVSGTLEPRGIHCLTP